MASRKEAPAEPPLLTITPDSTVRELFARSGEAARQSGHRGPVRVNCTIGGHVFTFETTIVEVDGQPIPQRRKTDH